MNKSSLVAAAGRWNLESMNVPQASEISCMTEIIKWTMHGLFHNTKLDYTISSCYLLGKGGYVFGSVGLSVCLWATLLNKL